MSALSIPHVRSKPGDACKAGGTPFLKLHRCRLDYDAALREHLRGGCASRVARAAGSAASSPRNLRRVGLKIVARLKNRYDVLATFDRLGYTVVDFCRGVIEQTQAEKTTRRYYRGQLVGEHLDPDWRRRTDARQQYLHATGILTLPYDGPVPAEFETLYRSRSPEAWEALRQLSDAELTAVFELARERVRRTSLVRPA